MNDPSPPQMQKLQLKATDSEDIQTLSALLQDALITPADMSYDPKQRHFVLLANRYCWEISSASYRCLCGLNISDVVQLQHRNMAVSGGHATINQFYNLLALSYDEATKTLLLTFSDGAELLCHLERVNIMVQDVSVPHPSLRTPKHEPE